MRAPGKGLDITAALWYEQVMHSSTRIALGIALDGRIWWALRSSRRLTKDGLPLSLSPGRRQLNVKLLLEDLRLADIAKQHATKTHERMLHRIIVRHLTPIRTTTMDIRGTNPTSRKLHKLLKTKDLPRGLTIFVRIGLKGEHRQDVESVAEGAPKCNRTKFARSAKFNTGEITGGDPLKYLERYHRDNAPSSLIQLPLPDLKAPGPGLEMGGPRFAFHGDAGDRVAPRGEHYGGRRAFQPEPDGDRRHHEASRAPGRQAPMLGRRARAAEASTSTSVVSTCLLKASNLSLSTQVDEEPSTIHPSLPESQMCANL